jgi:hypothetical protein
MEIKQAFLSSNIAIASSAQNVASGIEIAAAKPGGLGAIADSFQGFQPSEFILEKTSQFATTAAIETPTQYATRLNQFNREASGLVSSSDLVQQMANPNLQEASFESIIGLSQKLVQKDHQDHVDQMKERLDQLKKEAEEAKDAQSAGFWNQIGSFFTGSDGGGSELQVAIQDMLSRFQDAVNMGSQVEKKIRDASNDMTRKIG